MSVPLSTGLDPATTAHNQTLPSDPPAASKLPSALNATYLTLLLVSTVHTYVPVCRFTNLTTLSSPPLATRFPFASFGSNAIQLAMSLCLAMYPFLLTDSLISRTNASSCPMMYSKSFGSKTSPSLGSLSST